MIKIDNEELASYVMFKLNKIENSFTKEELATIKDITLNSNTFLDNFKPINLDVLKLFPNLESLELLNMDIYNNDFKVLLSLKSLKSVTFDRCQIENANLIASFKIEELSIINCHLGDYKFLSLIKDLTKLSLNNETIDFNILKQLQKLIYLNLSYSKINNLGMFNFNKLKELYIDNTNISKLNILDNLKELELLSISSLQYNENMDYVKKLIKNKVIIMNEGITGFGDING